MNRTSLLSEDWNEVVTRLGGSEALTASARETKAFLRPRGIRSAVDLLRMVLAYAVGHGGFRSTAGWAAAMGLADISDVALRQRLRNCGDWLTVLVGRLLAPHVPSAAAGRLIRIVDATTVAKAGRSAKLGNGLWRLHGAFDVPQERFSFFELTEEDGAEQFDRAPVVAGEIRLGDRVYLQVDRLAAVLSAGGDVVVRAGWRGARWRDAAGRPVDLIKLLKTASSGLIDRPIWLERAAGQPALGLRLVAVRMPAPAGERARAKARRQAQKDGRTASDGTLAAADWTILVTSLNANQVSSHDVLALYRLRWRIELAFKRLKSLVGLNGPPGYDEASARPYLLAHLLCILLLEPLVDALEDSPRWAPA